MAQGVGALWCWVFCIAIHILLSMDYGKQHPFICLQSGDQGSAIQSVLDLCDYPNGTVLLSDSWDYSVIHHYDNAVPVHSAAVPGVACGGYAVYTEAFGRENICTDVISG